LDIDSISSSLTHLFGGVTLSAPTIGVVCVLLAVVFMLFISGFVSASEIAFFSLSPVDKSAIEEEELPVDKLIKKLLDDSERLLATILISNNFVNIAIIISLNFAFSRMVDFGGNRVLEFLVVTVLLTFLLLLFGEIIPKIYSAQNSLRFCRFAASGIYFFERLFWPFAGLLVRSKSLASRVVQEENYQLSVDELEHALELTDKNEIKDEQPILEGIIRFGGETVRKVMTPRLDVVDLNIRSNFHEVIQCIIDNNYSRIPVYSESKDNIKGVLYIKDLLPHLGKPATFRWQSLIRPPYFVPETKMVDDLLRDFQTNKVHIAIVVDEFGGTSGIITMEDILEEIVGEINDEYDEDERLYTKLNATTYVFEGKILLTDFCKILKLNEDVFQEVEGEADTLAGMLLEIKGEFPKPGEAIDYKNYHFEVTEMDKRRILKVKLVIRKNDASA
jgi:gliding motility-associated protein GldE